MKFKVGDYVFIVSTHPSSAPQPATGRVFKVTSARGSTSGGAYTVRYVAKDWGVSNDWSFYEFQLAPACALSAVFYE